MQRLEELTTRALGLMKSAGFPISQEVSVVVDKKLPFMGYSTEKNGKQMVVIAEWALQSEMLIGLLIHELSHIYRTETLHPSHNFALRNKVLTIVFGNKKLLGYQQEIINSIINSIQDLYADDIFFKIFKDHSAFNLSSFFLDWIHTPAKGSTIKDTWTNAGYVVSTAFAQANLERHKVKDSEGLVENGVKDFLSQVNPQMAKSFNYFKKTMVSLPENITEEEFGSLLLTYIRNFLSLIS